MADDLITFVIDGGEARSGNVSASVLATKFQIFLATMYGLERAYSESSKRQLDLEIVKLSRNSPARITMRPRAKTQGYDADAALKWGVEQLEKIRAGRPDPRVPESVLSNVVNLADYRTDKAAEISLLRVEFGDREVPLDDVMSGNALLARAAAVETNERPWRAGVSQGSVFGELRGVMDVDGERKFYISPPSGPAQVQCVFSEGLRPDMVKNLFKVVRATGFLHYDGKSAHPYLLEASGIEGQSEPNVHMLDLAGAFPDLDHEPFVSEVA